MSPHIGFLQSTRELKKGSAEFLILSLVEVRARHGYEIVRAIGQVAGGEHA